MHFKNWSLVLILLFPLLLLTPSAATGQSRAMEELLRILEEKSLVRPEEAQGIRETMAEEQRKLIEREKELDARERALDEREQRLEAVEPLPAGSAAAEMESAGRSTAEPSLSGPVESLPLEAVFDDGFVLRTKDPNRFSLRVGGLLQTDYRFYDYRDDVDPDGNKFDIRRARLILESRIFEYFDCKFEYEFQGASSRNLLDAYVDVHPVSWMSIRAGQFKEPFSLEQVTKDGYIPFAERSMGYYLTPRRDVGIMAHASLWNERVSYALGLFNGDGQDDVSGGDVDEPQVAGRLVLRPLAALDLPLLEQLQLGGSFTHARIDRNNVKVDVQTTGLTSIFSVTSSAKFNVILNAGTATRYGAELGWAYGPFAFMGEYVRLNFRDLETSGAVFDADMEDYYVALLWMITGEEPRFQRGVFTNIEPEKSLFQGGWGALGLAFRFDRFEAEESVYDDLVNPGDSIRRATGFTLALNWILNASTKIVLDATRTTFDQPLLVGRDPVSGQALFSDREDVITARFQIGF
jgi:phosphate-selective porin OprO/OprP